MSHVLFKHAGSGAPLLVLPTNTLDVCFDASKDYFKCARWLLKVLVSTCKCLSKPLCFGGAQQLCSAAPKHRDFEC